MRTVMCINYVTNEKMFYYIEDEHLSVLQVLHIVRLQDVRWSFISKRQGSWKIQDEDKNVILWIKDFPPTEDNLIYTIKHTLTCIN